MNDDLVLYLDLFSPAAVQGYELLLRVESVAKNAEDALLRRHQLQFIYSFGF